MQFAQWHNSIGSHLRGVVTMLFVVVCAISCSNEQNIVAMTDVNLTEWDKPITVSLLSEQAESEGDLTIVLHVNRNFKAKQVELEIVSMTADSLRYTERITSEPQIVWPAATAQSVDVEIPYRHRVMMRKAGPYSYTITPLSPLRGVESAGMSFKTENR